MYKKEKHPLNMGDVKFSVAGTELPEVGEPGTVYIVFHMIDENVSEDGISRLSDIHTLYKYDQKWICLGDYYPVRIVTSEYVGDRKIAEETTIEYREVETVDLYSHFHAVDAWGLAAYPDDTSTYL